MTKCWFCETEMILEVELSSKNYSIYGEGVLVNLSCPGCNATAEFYKEQEDYKEETDA